jgi:hypothetical protein
MMNASQIVKLAKLRNTCGNLKCKIEVWTERCLNCNKKAEQIQETLEVKKL